ncbi:U-box domain-containing protein 51 [Argentina anserina]|uniref:U-box domain-containing protein 51 n=1 Tax=Argentina anserina TaxID=57926 RepID=UPI002176284D|nr:U-box domain-containing protein 51 [Potentilla anserina]
MATTYDNSTPINATAVAVDKDNKNSNTAVRWAIDHLVISNPYIILIHVKQKSHNYDGDGGESDHHNVFLPFRGYCARKGIQVKEVILEEPDVAKAILDYITSNYINNIVVGASTRNALTRRLKGLDVPSSLSKAVPEFCSVYVVHKGKMLSVRTARRPVVNTVTPPKQPPVQVFPTQSPTEQSVGENVAKTPTRERTRTGQEKLAATRERTRSAPMNLSLDNIDIQNETGSRSSISSARNSTAEEYEFSVPIHSFGSVDISSQNLDFSSSPRDSSRQSAREIEAEMKRLKQELKQTMDMYSSACKEAISAKNKAKELDQWKQEEARKFHEARLAEENALAIVEMEKAKSKAAIEAAETAQRLAEKEAQRRIQAEMKAKREAEEKNRALSALAHNDVRYRKYTIEEIEQATDNFADSMKIGEGGYGPVYKGKLDHTPVAIKVLRPDAAQGRKQFQQEVEVLSCIRYPNMVLLLGACPEYGCLVYEYMDNGSLEDRLLRRGNTPPISWRKRFKIAAEISTALLFLHQAKPEPLVHRDLKPANILLDRNYVSKISDVGLARLVPASVADEVTQCHMTSAAGTFCYIDPEYQQTGMLTTKSDIYSLGIVLLQIITAKPAMGLSHHVRRSIEKGTFADMLDPTVLDWPVQEALDFANLALKCTELRKRDRPDLGKVIVPELNRLRDFGKSKVDGLTGNMYSRSAYSDHAPNSLTYITSSSEEPTRMSTGSDRSKR